MKRWYVTATIEQDLHLIVKARDEEHAHEIANALAEDGAFHTDPGWGAGDFRIGNVSEFSDADEHAHRTETRGEPCQQCADNDYAGMYAGIADDADEE